MSKTTPLTPAPSAASAPEKAPEKAPVIAAELAASLDRLTATGKQALDALGQHLHQSNNGLAQLLSQQTQLAEQLTQEIQLAHTERAFLDDASSAAARLWLRNPNNKPVIDELYQQGLSKAERTALFGNEGLFTALNYRTAQMLTTTQVLTLIKTPKLREKFAQADFIKLFAQADFIKLFAQADFIKLFAQADFIKLFEQPLFIKALTPQALLKHFADPAFTRAFNPTQQLAAFQHTQLQRLLNTQEGLKRLEQAAFVTLFNQAEFIKLFNQADFASSLAKPEVLNKITTARSSNAAQFAQWPKIASTAKPVLGYFDTQYVSDNRVQTQRNAISKRYALALDTSSQSQIQTAVQQAQINTLIYPLGTDHRITSNAVYRDFLALGGRLIVNLYDKIPEQFLNHSFGWALDYTTYYSSSERLQATDLTTATPGVRSHVWCVSRTSLPAGAKVFLSAASNADHIAGFYIRYGLGEVIGIGYDWWNGSDSAWDALLHGLIQGTALPYQRRYG